MTRTTYALALLGMFAALAIAGCGGSGGGSSESSPETSAKPAEAGQEALTSAQVSGLGAVLVSSEGLTVYEFAKDQGATSSCYGECEKACPPVTTKGTPTAGEGASSSQLGTTKRKDGRLQVTYAGHPLYTFIEDKSPGEANGNGAVAFGGEWWALDESGAAVEGGGEAEGESEGAESSESSGGGYSGY